MEKLILISYIVAAISGVLAFLRYKERSFALLITLLVLIIVGEATTYFLVGRASQKFLIAKSNILIGLEFSLYYIIYFFLLKSRKFKLIALSIFGIYGLSLVVNSLLFQKMDSSLQSYSYLVGSIGLFIVIMFFFYELLNNLKGNEKFYTHFWFWISAGLMVFLASETPIIVYLQHCFENRTNPHKSWSLLKYITSIVYYLIIFPLALICSKK